MKRRIIPDIVKDQAIIHSLSPDATAAEAAKLMTNRDVGAVAVLDASGHLAGIVSERDVTRRVVAKGLDPAKVTVADFMTHDPDTVGPDDTALEALEIMRVRHYRHLPVAADGKIVGMLSVRDLYEVLKEELEHSIRETEAFVFGDRYGH